MDLSFDHHGIDHHPAIVDHYIPQNLDVERVRIDLDDHSMNPIRRSAALGSEELGRLEAGRGPRLHRAAHGVGSARQFAEGDANGRLAAANDVATLERYVLFLALQVLGAEFERTL